MPLVVETGAGVPQADSWVSLENAEAHFSAYGGSWTGPDPAKESALRRAALWLSTSIKWHGAKVRPSANMLAWPRTGSKDCDGVAIAENEIPPQLILAQLAAASIELQTPGGLTPVVDLGRVAKREKVDVIETEYMTATDLGVGKLGIDALRPAATQINDLIRCLATLGPNRQFELIRG